MVIGAKPWLADTQHPLYEAGKAAVKRGARTIPLLHFKHISLMRLKLNQTILQIVKMLYIVCEPVEIISLPFHTNSPQT